MDPSLHLPFPARTTLFALMQLACLALVADVPQTLPFQGRVSVDGVPFTGSGQFKFALLTVSDTVAWISAADSNPADGEPDAPVNLAVSKGLYSVPLGQGMNPLPAILFSTYSDLRLRVWFNDGTHGFQRLNPDQPLGSVAYAQRSQSAASADVAQLAQSVANGAILESKLANNAVSNLKLASDPGSLAKVSAGVVASTTGNLKVNPGTLYGVNPSDSFQYDSKFMGHYSLTWMQDSWSPFGPTLWMSGYGGLKFFAGGALALSIGSGGKTLISGDTTIGNSGDYRLLTVEGRIMVENPASETTLHLKNNTADGRLWTLVSAGTGAGIPPGSFSILDPAANAARMLISPSGQVGINTTTPGATLDVNGNTAIRGHTTIGNSGDDRLLTVEGRVGIGVSNPDAPLSIRRDSANSSFGYCITLADGDGTPWWKLGAANTAHFSIGAAGLRDYDISIAKASGNVGIGGLPYANRKMRVAGGLGVDGGVYAEDGFHSVSDSRLKTHVDRIEGALARVDTLRGVTFHWRQDHPDHPRPKGRQIGFIAQDVASVVPELVHTNADGYLSVNYDGVAPVLVEAVHEMKQQFDARLAEKNAEIQVLQTRLSKLESALTALLNRAVARPDDSPNH